MNNHSLTYSVLLVLTLATMLSVFPAEIWRSGEDESIQVADLHEDNIPQKDAEKEKKDNSENEKEEWEQEYLQPFLPYDSFLVTSQGQIHHLDDNWQVPCILSFDPPPEKA